MSAAWKLRGFALVMPWVGAFACLVGLKMAWDGFVGRVSDVDLRSWEQMKHGIFGIVVFLSGIGAYYGGHLIARSLTPSADDRSIREMASDARTQALGPASLNPEVQRADLHE